MFDWFLYSIITLILPDPNWVGPELNGGDETVHHVDFLGWNAVIAHEILFNRSWGGNVMVCVPSHLLQVFFSEVFNPVVEFVDVGDNLTP